MNSKLLSEKALAVIDQYTHFQMNGAMTSVPYYNNNHQRIRAALRATTGKGSPKDIFDETEILLVKEGSRDISSPDLLRHFLVDYDIGIDCSGFAYYVLNAESLAQKKGTLAHSLRFPFSKGLVGKVRCKIRPIENADARTFASNKNSHVISEKEIKPGDIITMIAASGAAENRDHILVITQVEYQNFVPITIHYAHSIAWPTDGEYGHGVRTGMITIANIAAPLTSQLWTEAGKTADENYTLARAMKSQTELRRLNWF